MLPVYLIRYQNKSHFCNKQTKKMNILLKTLRHFVRPRILVSLQQSTTNDAIKCEHLMSIMLSIGKFDSEKQVQILDLSRQVDSMRIRFRSRKYGHGAEFNFKKLQRPGIDLVVRDLACHVISLNAGCLWVTPSAIPGLHRCAEVAFLNSEFF